MLPAALLLSIKDLKDLSFLVSDYYRHAGPNGPEEMFSRVRSRGTGPRATVFKAVSVYRKARACPSPCLDREGNGFGWRLVFARVGRSRGTGPRATGQGAVLLATRRSGAGAPELQSLANLGNRANLAQSC